jgi:hypothetical protein
VFDTSRSTRRKFGFFYNDTHRLEPRLEVPVAIPPCRSFWILDDPNLLAAEELLWPYNVAVSAYP